MDCLNFEEVTPVCSSAFLKGPNALRKLADLRRQTLLHADLPFKDDYPDWRMWLTAAGVQDCDVERGPRFTMASVAVQAAIAGQGVALAGSVLVEDDVAAGRLVNSFEVRFPVKIAYYLVCPQASVNQPCIVDFRNWLKAKAWASARREPFARALITSVAAESGEKTAPESGAGSNRRVRWPQPVGGACQDPRQAVLESTGVTDLANQRGFALEAYANAWSFEHAALISTGLHDAASARCSLVHTLVPYFQ